MIGTEKIIKWSTAGAVLGVATVASAAFYEHAYELVRMHGESGWTARLASPAHSRRAYLREFDGDA